MKKLILISTIFISSVIFSFGCGGDGEYGPGKSEGVCYEDGTCDYGLSCDVADDICRASIVPPPNENTSYGNSCSHDEDCDDFSECVDGECAKIEDE